jgi:RNA polymerase sigma-70 factor (ECF subfamily)
MAVAPPNEASAGHPRRDTLEGLFRALESALLGYAHRLVSNSDAAEDVVQEAFLRLHGQFDQVREPRKWLYRTVHNLALNHQRRAVRTVSLEQQEGAGMNPSNPAVDPLPLPDEQIARWENVGLVRLTLESLDPRSRELIRLKFQENLSYKEITERTGLTSGHVGYLLHHALKAVATELARNGVIP